MTENPEKTRKSRAKLHELEDSIYTNQLNNSTSKQLYSLSKEPRWKQSRKNPHEPELYNLPSMMSNRSASFGYGHKIDISKLASKAPSPDSYKLQSDFQLKNKGVGIGLGRDKVKAVSAFGQKPFIVPGVGSYSIKDTKSNQTISFKSRVVDLSDKWVRQVPGPGTYQTLQLLDKNLKSLNSKFGNGRSQRFAKGEERNEFQKKVKKNYVPGPGQYNYDKRNYDIIDHYIQHKGRSFGKTPRPDIGNRSGFPGPGSYRHASEFIH